MNKIAITLILCFIGIYGLTQSYVVPFEAKKKGGWGYLSSNGSVLIANMYKDADPFYNGVAFVFDSKQRKWMVIDQQNNVVDVQLKDCEPKSVFGFGRSSFEDGLALVTSNGMLAYINPQGEVVVPAKFEKLSKYRDGYTIGRIGSTFYIIDEQGNQVKVNASCDNVLYVVNGYAPYKSQSSGLFGFVDKDGNKVIDAKFKKVGYFYNNLAWARTEEGSIGFIDTKGNWVIDAQFNKVTDFDKPDKIVSAKKGDQWVFLKHSGEEFSVSGATAIGEFQEGLAWVKIGDNVGVINKSGDWVVNAQYEVIKDYELGLAQVRKNGMWGLIDKAGNEVVECQYEKFGRITNDLIEFESGGLWGFMDKKGNIVVQPIYDDTKPFENGYTIVRKGRSWGIINTAGKEVVTPQYSSMKVGSILK